MKIFGVMTLFETQIPILLFILQLIQTMDDEHEVPMVCEVHGVVKMSIDILYAKNHD